ncbi:MAG: branched-chain amino acid ABC transporter permease [Acidimicrobiia bacterium]|nr:branched-chain amino acid ABC transporter permease [Acidimicrobiia bacterium]MDH3396608.1 branched-chain amino acid ABC transporter permease [Acidimicrobiia bacterium]
MTTATVGKKRASRLNFTNLFRWVVGSVAVVVIFYGSIKSVASGRLSWAQWRDLMVFGVAQGSVYALIAMGYTMVYGVLRFINFAHGEVFMSGAMIGYFVADALNRAGIWNEQPVVSLLIVLLVSMTTATSIAVILERVAYRPLRGAPRLIPLITSIGASFTLQYLFRGLFGAGTKAYPPMAAIQGKWIIFGIPILKSQVIVIGSAIVVMAGLYLFVEKTKTGRSMRAVAEDPETAALMGINVDGTIVKVFAVGGAMAGVAGALWTLVFPTVNFFSGFLPGIKAFTAAVLGGIGNIFGAMLGGVSLGMFESVGPSLVLGGYEVPAFNQLKDVVAFSALVLVLIFRPTGILGERLAQERG